MTTALTAIPDDFGSGGAGLTPKVDETVQSLVDILQDHHAAIGEAQVSVAALEAAAPILTKTVTITHADLTSAVNGTAQAINIGTALPTNALVVGCKSKLNTAFSGGSVSACHVDVGGTDIDGIIAQQDVFTGASTAATDLPAGVKPQGLYSAQQLVATFTPDGSHTLLALSAGSITITVYYFVAG